jgi:hypothetical protein
VADADPAHLEQVLPDPKGVVVLVPSRQERDYGDRWLRWIIQTQVRIGWLRNGEHLYMMTTDPRVGDRLLPKREEFAEFFYTELGFGRDRERVPLEPGSDAWLKAEAAADRRRRHYMRSSVWRSSAPPSSSWDRSTSPDTERSPR